MRKSKRSTIKAEAEFTPIDIEEVLRELQFQKARTEDAILALNRIDMSEGPPPREGRRPNAARHRTSVVSASNV